MVELLCEMLQSEAVPLRHRGYKGVAVKWPEMQGMLHLA